MFVETTININIKYYNKLTEAADASGLSRGQIISSLMRRLADDFEIYNASWSSVRYQKKDVKKNWRQLYLTLTMDEYEYFIDLRKFLKLSISRIVAIVIDKYLDEIMYKVHKNTNNYRYHNYIFSKNTIDGIICWVLYWGLPKKLLPFDSINTT
jgi:hypothetical protein